MKRAIPISRLRRRSTATVGVWSCVARRRSTNDPSSSAHEIYEARRLVELPTVRLAVERMDDAGIQRLRRSRRSAR